MLLSHHPATLTVATGDLRKDSPCEVRAHRSSHNFVTVADPTEREANMGIVAGIRLSGKEGSLWSGPWWRRQAGDPDIGNSRTEEEKKTQRGEQVWQKVPEVRGKHLMGNASCMWIRDHRQRFSYRNPSFSPAHSRTQLRPLPVWAWLLLQRSSTSGQHR